MAAQIGQGEPLPEFMKLDGEWIVKGYIFLYHTKDRSFTPATFTMAAAREDGDFAVGFDSAQLAGAFGIEIDMLIEANQNHSLVFLGEHDGTPIHGGTVAKNYIFAIGDLRGYVTVETNQQEGTA